VGGIDAMDQEGSTTTKQLNIDLIPHLLLSPPLFQSYTQPASAVSFIDRESWSGLLSSANAHLR